MSAGLTTAKHGRDRRNVHRFCTCSPTAQARRLDKLPAPSTPWGQREAELLPLTKPSRGDTRRGPGRHPAVLRGPATTVGGRTGRAGTFSESTQKTPMLLRRMCCRSRRGLSAREQRRLGRAAGPAEAEPGSTPPAEAASPRPPRYLHRQTCEKGPPGPAPPRERQAAPPQH